jgi:hypothetical protein
MGVFSRAIYTQRTETFEVAERRKMMQQWADYLDRLKAGAVALPFAANGAGTMGR